MSLDIEEVKEKSKFWQVYIKKKKKQKKKKKTTTTTKKKKKKKKSLTTIRYKIIVLFLY